jgi:2,5-furandicarboxylate decarboxylase 1
MVARDQDSGIRNVAFHRLQIKGPRKTGALIVPRHTREILNKHEARDQPMPVAIFIGHHPLYYMAAASTGAFEMDELELAGGLIGESAKVVKCETNDLEVPFDAEIILEGRILPNVREDEGPFSEFHDYYVAGMGKNPVIEIDCITRRHDAIFKAIQNGSEVEGCVFHKVPFGVAVYNHIKNIGGYVNLHNLLVLPGLFGIVVQMTPRFYGEAKQILMGVLSSPILPRRWPSPSMKTSIFLITGKCSGRSIRAATPKTTSSSSPELAFTRWIRPVSSRCRREDLTGTGSAAK